jgi:hypothetical protein
LEKLLYDSIVAAAKCKDQFEGQTFFIEQNFAATTTEEMQRRNRKSKLGWKFKRRKMHRLCFSKHNIWINKISGNTRDANQAEISELGKLKEIYVTNGKHW